MQNELGYMKHLTHAAFDVFWRSGYEHRSKSYGWMRRSMGKGHIADLTVDECFDFISRCDQRRHDIGLDMSPDQSTTWAPFRYIRAEKIKQAAIAEADRLCDLEDLYA